MNGASVSVPDATLAVRRASRTVRCLEFAGHWLSQRGLPEPSSTLLELRATGVSHLAFDARQITAWDSGLVTFVLKVLGEMAAGGVAADRAGAARRCSPAHRDGGGRTRTATGRTGAAPPVACASRHQCDRGGTCCHGLARLPRPEPARPRCPGAQACAVSCGRIFS